MPEWFSDPQGWISLLTLTVLEVVLGIDNIIFISILAGKLRLEEQPRARSMGLAGAFLTRVLLLLSISWVMRLTAPLFHALGRDVSGRDLILLVGGFFLIAKATKEIHHKLEGPDDEAEQRARATSSLWSTVAQIMVIDIVFSLDSVITAVGMADDVSIMITANVLALGVMLLAARSVSDFVDRHPTVKMLALAFLVLIGTNLVAEGMGQHIPKGYTYMAMAFSVLVEMLNIRARGKTTKALGLIGALWLLGASAAPADAQERGAARSPADSVRAVTPPGPDPLKGSTATIGALGAQARTQQDAFERNHRMGLRFYNGGADASCEVPLGRICYWNNNGDVPPPAERSDARLEREQLLEVLGRAQAADPKDDWVSGMRVRYAIEAQLADTAVAAARACAGTAWWCAALEGLALHVANRHAPASAAFDRAIVAMPEAQRCAWSDLTWWLDPASHPAYAALSCARRSDENARIFRLAQPLWMLDGNDARNEWFARHTISRVHSLGRIPYDLQWGNDLLESQVRYGWPAAWSVQNGGVADPRPPQVIGHEPTPSYDFMPTPAVLAAPLTATPAAWDPRRKVARMRYATRYASGFGALPHQFARFRRGDTTVLAGGYRLIRDLEMGRAPYTAALTLDAMDGAAPRQIRKDSTQANGALLLPMNAPMLASLEVLAPQGKRAARVRTTVQPIARDARLSDYLLLQRGDPSPVPTLERNAAQAYGSGEIEGGTQIGIYWEMYRPASPTAPLQVAIRATRLGASFMQKVGSALGLSKALTPVSIRYNDNGRPDGGAGRSLTLNFPSVPPGDYQLTLMVSGAGTTDSTTRVIRVNAAR